MAFPSAWTGRREGDLARRATVPSGFVVTATTCRPFLEETGIDVAIEEIIDVDPDEQALADPAEQAQFFVVESTIPWCSRIGNFNSGQSLAHLRGPVTGIDCAEFGQFTLRS